MLQHYSGRGPIEAQACNTRVVQLPQVPKKKERENAYLKQSFNWFLPKRNAHLHNYKRSTQVGANPTCWASLRDGKKKCWASVRDGKSNAGFKASSCSRAGAGVLAWGPLLSLHELLIIRSSTIGVNSLTFMHGIERCTNEWMLALSKTGTGLDFSTLLLHKSLAGSTKYVPIEWKSWWR